MPDETTPNSSRMYDYWLGGVHNYAADRRLAEQIAAESPSTVYSARANRAFLRAAIALARGHGVRQFLDVGSGIPTVGNVHQVAQADDPDVRVVYVDHDLVPYNLSRNLLKDNPTATILHADVRDPAGILDHPETRDLFDLDQPVALTMAAVLHFVPDDDHPAAIVAAFSDRLAPGSWLAISHLTEEGIDPAEARYVEARYQASNPLRLRTRDAITAMFDGWRLHDPGLTWVDHWYDTEPPQHAWLLAATAELVP